MAADQLPQRAPLPSRLPTAAHYEQQGREMPPSLAALLALAAGGDGEETPTPWSLPVIPVVHMMEIGDDDDAAVDPAPDLLQLVDLNPCQTGMVLGHEPAPGGQRSRFVHGSAGAMGCLRPRVHKGKVKGKGKVAVETVLAAAHYLKGKDKGKGKGKREHNGIGKGTGKGKGKGK